MIEIERQKRTKKYFYNNISVVFILMTAFLFINQNVNAELSYNFTNKKFANGITNEQKATLTNSQDDKSKYYYNFNPDDKQEKDKLEDKNKKNNKENKNNI